MPWIYLLRTSVYKIFIFTLVQSLTNYLDETLLESKTLFNIEPSVKSLGSSLINLDEQ